MAGASLVLLGLLGQGQGISLRGNAGDSLDVVQDPSLVGADCRDPAIGDHCFNAVKWSLERGVRDHPEWYPEFHGQGLTEDNFREMQLILHKEGKAGCAKPCPPFFTPYATLGSVTEPIEVVPPHRNIGEAKEAEPQSPQPESDIEKEMDAINAQHADITDMSMDSFSQFINDAKWRDAIAKTITTTEAETTLSEDLQVAAENTWNATSEEAQANVTEEAAPVISVQEKIDTLKAELEALESMESSPPIEAMRQEKRDELQSLQATLPAEDAEEKKKIDTLKAELEALESMESSPAIDAMVQEKRDQLQSLQKEAPAAVQPAEEGAPAAEPAADAAAAEPAAEEPAAPSGGDSSAEPAGADSQNATADAPPAEEQAAAAPAALDPGLAPAAEDPDTSTTAQEPAEEQAAQDAPGCHTSVEGDACYEEVMYSKETGVVKHPDKYAGLTPNSPFEDFQRHVHGVSSVCPEPCAPKGPASPAAAEAASTDSQSSAAVAAAPSAAEQPKGIKGWFSRFRRGAKEANKEPAAAEETAAEAPKFGALGREEQKLDTQSDAAEKVAEKEADMMAYEAQARVNQMEADAKMQAEVARRQAQEEAEMEAAKQDMLEQRAEAQKAKADAA